MIKGIIFDFNRTLYDPENDKLVDGAFDVLKTLSDKGYKMYLIGKKTVSDRLEKISELGIDKYFMDMVFVDVDKSVGDFVHAAKKMNLPYEEIAVVGDRIKSEIAVGNQAGMITIWYRNGKFSNEVPISSTETPNYKIKRLEEIMQYL
jgi:FMN phosphatase YigB (HAD superfamily)